MKRKSAGAPDFFSAQVSQARRFYLNLQPSRRTRLAVVCGGVEHCAPDYEIQRDRFPFYSIEYVVRGEGELRLGRQAGKTASHHLQPGTVFAYGPKISQHIRCSSKNPLVKYFVDFAGTGAEPWLRRHGLAAGIVSRVFPPHELQPLFDELIRSGQRGSGPAQELCDRLLECLGLKLRETRTLERTADSAAFATYHRCRQFLQDHFERIHSLEQAAAECHLDTAYLCRLFRRFDHQSPYQYLTRLKMNHAAGRLQEPRALVKGVAADLGYANPFHFSRVFKSVMGLAPEQFRKIR
jgi:AraC-like DNA-binding protein